MARIANGAAKQSLQSTSIHVPVWWKTLVIGCTEVKPAEMYAICANGSFYWPLVKMKVFRIK